MMGAPSNQRDGWGDQEGMQRENLLIKKLWGDLKYWGGGGTEETTFGNWVVDRSGTTWKQNRTSEEGPQRG